jgi:hypothetical protein
MHCTTQYTEIEHGVRAHCLRNSAGIQARNLESRIRTLGCGYSPNVRGFFILCATTETLLFYIIVTCVLLTTGYAVMGRKKKGI